jgi:Ca2+-transporting ATPase
MTVTATEREVVARGLTNEEARRRLARHGPNEVVPERRSRVLGLLKPIFEPMSLLLMGVGVLSWILGERRDAIVMFVAVVPVVLMDHILELRMERTLEALRRLVQPNARVLRDGDATTVPARELVPGDVLLVEEGCVVAADARVLEGADLLADESSLTGESATVPKGEGEVLLAGSTLVLGRGRALVERTGARTEYGKIGALVATIESPRTPLQEKLGRLVLWLSGLAIFACLGVAAIGLAHGLAWTAALLSGASLALAAVPEEFPLVFTLFLSLGVFRMAKRRALVRRWTGIEALGATTVIACDKTGTLTEGRLRLTRTWTPGEATTGSAPDAGAPRLLRLAVLASEPEPYDPLERALHEGCRDAGLDPVGCREALSLVKEHAFVRDKLRMSHIWRTDEGTLLLAMKGALEGVLPACALAAGERELAVRAHADLARRGMKVLAVATRTLESLGGARHEDEAGLRLEGLVGFADPPRPGVREALTRCRAAGIRVIMITGDHPATARAVAEELGLDGERVVVGEEIARGQKLEDVSVVARATPEQKHRIVQALRTAGEVVAMTGDGVNDAAALKQADVGIAMGERGTDVARAAATMVLLDDAFPTIVVAIEEGRRIYENIRKSFRYLIAFHIPIVTAALLAPLLRWPLLLLPVHLVWLELVAHPLSTLGFEGEPPEPGLMARPPRGRGDAILGLGESLRASALGVTVTIAALAAFLRGLAMGQPEMHARGLALAVIVVAQVGIVMTERTRTFALGLRSVRANPLLLLSCLGVIASAALVFGVPAVREIMHVEAPTPGEWGIAVGAAAAATLWPELVKLVRSGQ